jgi:hypothetical protein
MWLSLLLTVCITSPVTLAAESDPFILISAFQTWFSDRGGVHAGFSVVPVPSFRRWSVIANSDVHEGDLLFSVPLSATMCVIM